MKPLEQYTVKGGKELRMGVTTGSCAAAAAQAAATVLLSGQRLPGVSIDTPAGICVTMDVEETSLLEDAVCCGVRKDAGDDPDVTHQAMVLATVSKLPQGIEIDGGHGVGRVTQPGLACSVGHAAINPVPRKMIAQALQKAAAQCGYSGGLRVVISVPEGEALAKRTFNPRMGIQGGISILGTTGIVEPMSESALVATIRAEIDCLAAAERKALLVVPGNYGEDFAMRQWGLALDRGVKSSNFIGETLDYAVYQGFRRIVFLGHAGKLTKLAAGIFQTHSSVADGRMEILAAHGGVCGLVSSQLEQLLDCVTVDAADALLVQWGAAEAVWRRIEERVAFHLAHRVGEGVEIAFAAFGRRGILFASDNTDAMIVENFT